MRNRPKIDIDKLLQPVINAVTNESFSLGRDSATGKLIPNQITLDAITQFRETFNKTGASLDLTLISDVYQIYAKLTNAWNCDKRCALFEDGIVSFMLRYASRDDAMKFSQGLEYLQSRGETYNRSIITRDGFDFYESLRNSSSDFLNIEGSCVDITWGLAAKDRDRVAGTLVCDHLKALIAGQPNQANEANEAEYKLSEHNNSINSVNSSDNALASGGKSTDEIDEELLKFIPVTLTGFGPEPVRMKADQMIDFFALLSGNAMKDSNQLNHKHEEIRKKSSHDNNRFFSKATGMEVSRKDLTDAGMANFYSKIMNR